MSTSIRPIQAGDKQRWLVLWQGYLDFYKTTVAAEQTERTWTRIMDSEFNINVLLQNVMAFLLALQLITFKTQHGLPMAIAI